MCFPELYGGAVVKILKSTAIILIGIVSLIVSTSEAQWTENGIPVRTTLGDEYPAVIVTNDASAGLHETIEVFSF